MNGYLLINCFPIRIKKEKATIYISENDMEGLIPSSKSKITNRDDDRMNKIYWSPENTPDTNTQQIRPEKHRNLFRDYLNEDIYRYIKNLDVPCRRTFLWGTEVWIKNEENAVNFSIYDVFSMRVLSPKDQYATQGWTILLGYKGERRTLLKNYNNNEIPDEIINTFIYENEVFRSSKCSENKLPHYIEVVTNREISNFTGISPNYRQDKNKYLTHFRHITNFYETWLKGKQIGELIYVLESGMGQVLDAQVRRTSLKSNVLEFGSEKTQFNAYMGLKKYGPLSGPKVDSHKIFFIFHESKRDQANKLFQFFKRGFKGYPGLKSFVDVDLVLDKEKTINFTNIECPSEEIISKLSNMTFDEKDTYLAIYLSPIKKDESDEEKHADYFRVKEALLSKNISSQVIFAGNIDNPNFNFFLPNISIAILAKLGGKPWRLSREIKNELVIGIGAYRQKEDKFLGTTFTFRNDGTFVGFNATNCNAPQELGQFYEDTIKNFISSSDEEILSIKRVIIHFYKKMNRKEERQLTDALARLDLQVPYYVLNITGEHIYDFLVIDDAFQGKMPQSGLCVKLRNGEYLLCNNTRYKDRTGAKIDDYPFPLKISILRTSQPSLHEQAVNDLIDQVYQFSRMYWRSVKQRAIPVTILYSEEIAKIAANLPQRAVPQTDIAKQTLWFL